jgi:hypothetical protein
MPSDAGGAPSGNIPPGKLTVTCTSGHPCSKLQNLDRAAKELRNSKIAHIHEATLQDLLRCRNDAVVQLLYECNKFLRER